jgi:hypothetical protein
MAYKGSDRDILFLCGGKKQLFEGTLKENFTLQAATRLSYSFEVA